MTNIEPPKDAEGREISLDTGTLYKKNGIAKYIYHYGYDPRDKYWFAETDEGPRNTSEFLLNRPDSWKRLKEDLRRTMGASDAVCAYFGGDNRDCVACRLNKESFKGIPYCNPCLAFTDILDRIRKLKGEDR